MLRLMPANDRRTLALLAVPVLWLLLSGSPPPVSAQSAKAGDTCSTSSNTWWTTIIVRLNDRGVCVVDPYGGEYAATLLTRMGGPAEWHVCNVCEQKVDIRLNHFQGTMTALLPSMRPMPDSTDAVTAREIGPDMQWSVIAAAATNDPDLADHSYHYDVNVKLSTEDDTKWRSFHPQLQIERDGFFARFGRRVAIATGLIFAVIGFLLGRLWRG